MIDPVAGRNSSKNGLSVICSIWGFACRELDDSVHARQHSGSFLLLSLHLLLYLAFCLLNRLAPHLLDQFPSMLFADGLELLLLRRIEERRDLGIDCAADLLQLLDLLQGLERGVLLQRPQLLCLVLQEGENL